MSDFAKRLAQVRDLVGLSQKELATLVGMEPSMISHFEGGKREPSLENFIRIAKALNVSADMLLGLKRQMP